MNEYVAQRLGEIRINELRREAELHNLAVAARRARGAQRRLKPSAWFAWRPRWRAREAIT